MTFFSPVTPRLKCLSFFLVLSVVSGCVGTDEADDEHCRSLGASRGTDGYLQCRMWAETERRKRTEFERRVPTSYVNTDGFCMGYTRGYMTGYGQTNPAPISASAVPSCPTPPLQDGPTNSIDQGYQVGLQNGRIDGRK